jgi:hypothetical protein
MLTTDQDRIDAQATPAPKGLPPPPIEPPVSARASKDADGGEEEPERTPQTEQVTSPRPPPKPINAGWDMVDTSAPSAEKSPKKEMAGGTCETMVEAIELDMSDSD